MNIKTFLGHLVPIVLMQIAAILLVAAGGVRQTEFIYYLLIIFLIFNIPTLLLLDNYYVKSKHCKFEVQLSPGIYWYTDNNSVTKFTKEDIASVRQYGIFRFPASQRGFFYFYRIQLKNGLIIIVPSLMTGARNPWIFSEVQHTYRFFPYIFKSDLEPEEESAG